MEDRRLDHIEYTMSDVFGGIFEYMAVHYTFDSFCQFVPAFLKSDFVKRQWDTRYSRYQYHDPEESLDFALPELKKRFVLQKPGQKTRYFPGNVPGGWDLLTGNFTCLPVSRARNFPTL